MNWSQLHRCCLSSDSLFRHIAFLFSLLLLSHYKGALSFSKHLISDVPERECSADLWLARRGVGLGDANPCPPSLYPEHIFRLFHSHCPSMTPGFTEIFRLYFQLLGLSEHHKATTIRAKLRKEVNQ